MTSAAQWGAALLSALGAPASADNVRAVVLWQNHEGQGARENNPLATTQSGYGGTSNNGVGVKTYPTARDGLAATVHVLTSGKHGYPAIVAAFRAGDPYSGLQAVTASSWCPACAGYRDLAGELRTFTGSTYERAANREVAGDLAIPATSKEAATAIDPAIALVPVPGLPLPLPVPTSPGDVKKLVSGGVLGVQSVGRLLRWLIDPANWRRIGMGALGTLLVAYGLYLVVKDSRAYKAAESVAVKAALLAA